MTQPAPLKPYSFDRLLGRIAHEWESRHRIFDLPTARFWQAPPDVDLGFDFLGRAAATPVGPAAGPHSQMAQNLVLGWLAGARLFELKTVQALDELEIQRPCIDMKTVGFNIEWSQELHVEESLEEYVKGSMAIELLRHWEPLRPYLGEDPGPHVFDMSVGYDLEGISSAKVASFIDGMRDATRHIERLRPLIPDAFGDLRGLDFQPCVSDTITLSTFHGCPPQQIDAITRHLMERHDVDVIVKLNPTLLGYRAVRELLHGQLGYDDVKLVPEAFVDDLQFDRGVELIGRLAEFARQRGRRFGVKLTNTLVVQNDTAAMPEDLAYLSGPPLHVLATALLDELLNAMPGTFAVAGHDGDVQVSFSAGVSRENLAETLGMGVAPATMCSDLLKPGGYGRLTPMLRDLADQLRGAECADLRQWHERSRLFARARGFRGPVEAHLVAVVAGAPRQAYVASSVRPLRHVGHDLQMFGCVSCNVCVTVCPNDAFFRVPTPTGAGLAAPHQYMLLAELCNDCGNCLTFCPEEGDPAQVKPRLYLDAERFDAATGPGFLVRRAGTGVQVSSHPDWEEERGIIALLLDEADVLPVRGEDLLPA